MITSAAGVAAVGFSAHTPAIFWAGALMVLFFGLSEFYYIDIQEDAIARNRELEVLLDQLLKSGVSSDHEAYKFGLGKIFGGGRMLGLNNVKSWVLYRTFNPLCWSSWPDDNSCYHGWDTWKIAVGRSCPS
jgi:hypothetical protein